MNMEILKILLALMVLVNPVTAVPVFLSLTAGNTNKERQKIARTSALAICSSIVFFAVLGEKLLQIFNISIGAFQVGGGILLLLIAISMMNAQPNPTKTASKEEHTEAENKDSIAVVPLAIPILMGPGSISTVIIYSAAANSWWDILQIIIAGALVSLICYIAMASANTLAKVLGKTGINIINRVMGILLAAVSVEIMVTGIKSLFPLI